MDHWSQRQTRFLPTERVQIDLTLGTMGIIVQVNRYPNTALSRGLDEGDY